MYKSPITLCVERITEEMRDQQEKDVLHAVVRCGVEVDRDELIKALAYDREQYEKGYVDGRADAQNWISVEERLPENEEYVLVCIRGNSYIGYYEERGRYWEVEGCRDIEITHWMSLPEPPKEG